MPCALDAMINMDRPVDVVSITLLLLACITPTYVRLSAYGLHQIKLAHQKHPYLLLDQTCFARQPLGAYVGAARVAVQ